jgi:hypothetical protein
MHMAAKSNRGGRPIILAVGLFSLTFFAWGLPVRAADNPPDAGIQARLDAGEFAPAVDMARQAADPRQRDAQWGQIAAAQAQAGAQQAAVRSVAEVGDGQARARILAQIGVGNQNQNVNGQGGAGQADFQALMDLITSTVSPKSWEANGGQGNLSPFPTGVWVDPQGVLRPLLKEAKGQDLAALHAASQSGSQQDDARRSSPLRMISLTRLEREVQIGLALNRSPTEAMQALAGLQRIRYVFVYPDSGDLVLAGPAGDWTIGPEGAAVSVDSGLPVVRLDDLVVIFRHMMSGPDAKFGCMITPRQEALAKAQEFLKQWSHRAVPADARKTWLEQFRSKLGKQDIEVYGLDPRTRAARILVEADYRMKLVGMGLEEGVPGVVSYLNLIKGPPPPMGVLRWWFTLNYEAVTASKDRQAFALCGQGVKVESENEHLTAQGQRIHTGESETLNRQFAHSFTKHFDALCQKYPIYGELRNLCDLALTAALVREEGLADRVGWHMTSFATGGDYEVELGEAPKAVETVVNCRVVNQTTFIAGVSGGVRVAPAALVKRQAIQLESYPHLEEQRPVKSPRQQPHERWWWD